MRGTALASHEAGKSLLCVAIDLGAGSGRLIAGELRQGKLTLLEAGRFTTHSSKARAAGYQHWEIDAIEAHMREGLALCTSKGSVASVGVDSWGVDYVLLDESQRRIGEPVCYRDDRTEGMMEKVQSRVAAEEIYRRTGIQFQRFNTLYQLAASAEQEPAWMLRARHLLMIPDYLHFRLCGMLANEYTNATTTQMLGVDGAWDKKLLAAAGVSPSLMLPPVAAGTVLGTLQSSRTKVIAPATHDTASAVAGTPLESADEAYISSGTWSLMGVESNTPFVSMEAMRMNFTNEGGVEWRFRVLKNITGMWPLQRVCDEHSAQDLEAVVEAAAQASAWRSVVNLDDAAFMNPASMSDAIRAACRCSGQQEPASIAELARCIFDSLALSYRKVKEELESLRRHPLLRIRIVGGGCRNALLNQLCADACQLPVSAGPVEASALGNLSVQMIALGALEDLDAARNLIRASFQPREFQPRASVPDSVWRLFQHVVSHRDASVHRGEGSLK